MIKRTTIEIDQELLDRARRALGERTTRGTVEEALRRAAESAESEQVRRTAKQQHYFETLGARGRPYRTRFGGDVALNGWLLDKSAAARSANERVRAQLSELAGSLFLCPIGQLEQLYSARSAQDYDALAANLRDAFQIVSAPPDVFDRALDLQRDLAHHHGMWHRTPLPDLLLACTGLHHGLGIVHVDRDFERIAEVRPLAVRRLL